MDTLSAVITLPEFSQLPENVTERLAHLPGEIISADGHAYIMVHGRVFSSEDNPGGRSVLEAIARVTENRQEDHDFSLQGIWRRCIKYGDENSIRLLTGKYRVQDRHDRCVILFQHRQMGETVKLSVLSELTPKSDDEVFFDTYPFETALIRNCTDLSLEDMIEYAEAVSEFAESEMGMPLMIGIGSIQSSLASLHQSYLEAAQSLQVGREFHRVQPVHAYQKQILERILSSVPAERRTELKKDIFNDKAKKLLNAEMVETVRVFFENDLNLSTTAKKLYLHRNTLTYRLDRIRRETGLDLRTFKDAAAFKAIMDCESISNE